MALYVSKPGILCCAGSSIEEFWDSLKTGNQKGIKQITTITGENFYAARIDDEKIKEGSGRYKMRSTRIEETALDQISDEIEIVKNKYGADRIGVCVGSCDNGMEFSIIGHRAYFQNGEFPKDYSLEMQGADYVATFVSEKYGLKGPACNFSTACSSSACAVIKAAEMIQGGIIDAAVVGGVDLSSDTVLVGFNALETISDEITNPLSKNRHGITLGEAAAFCVISKDPIHVEDNAASIQLLGWGESADAYHMTSPDPSGAGAEKAIRRALERAEIKPEDVDYINLHGTGTKLNDSMETKAVDAIFGNYKVPVSSTKSITGHTLGAAAAVELAVCYLAINNIGLPIHVWDEEQDPELPVLNIVDKKTKNPEKVNICISNSFGFGGANACLVIGKK